MKVLTVTNMWPYPGKIYYGIFVKEQVEAISRHNPGIRNRVWFFKGYRGKMRYIASIFAVNLHLLFNRYDVIHIHSALSGLFLIAGPRRRNAIITLHGTEILDPEQYRVSRRVARKAARLICVSAEIEAIVKRDMPRTSTVVIPCAVLETMFVDRRVKPDGKIRIAFSSARWRTVKNYPLFEEIIARLRLISQYEIETVEFDNKTRAEMVDDLNSIDLLLITSFHEGSPQIVKEALCCNTPVVSSRVGTVASMLEGLDNCAVINGYNPQPYVAAIAGILLVDNVRFPVRSNGRSRIFELRYDEQTITTQILKIYNRLVQPPLYEEITDP
jgi:glycosyltransferase involved in cell wall biosynthesis